MRKALFAICVLLLFASAACAEEVHFQWGSSSGQVDGYRIYCGTVYGGPYSVQLCEVDGVTHEHKMVLKDTQEYYLVVRAFNRYGESGDSNEVCWTVFLPKTPIGVYVSWLLRLWKG